MNIQKRVFQYLLILVLTLQVISAQTVAVQKSLNLQSQERYVQHLSEFVDSPFSTISWPDSNQVEQVLPYSELNTYTIPPPMSQLAKFRVGETTQYIIGMNEQPTGKETVQLIVTYQTLYIDKTCNCIQLTSVYTQNIDEIPTSSLQNYASFYTATNGFISYTSDEKLKTYSFSYNENNTQRFTFTLIKKLKLNSHVAIQGPSNTVFVIQYVDDDYQLIKFDASLNIIFTKTTPRDTCLLDMPIIDTGRYYLNYCFSGNLRTVSINFKDETLVVNNFFLSNELAFTYAYKRFGELFVIALGNENNSTIITLKSDDSNISSPFQWVKSDSLPFSLDTFNIVTPNLLAEYTKNTLSLIDISKKTIVFQTNPIESGSTIRLIQSLGQQALLHIYDSNNNYVNSISTSLSLPALIITASAPFTTPLILQLQTISSISIDVSITVNIVQQNIVFFSKSSAFSQKTFVSLDQELSFIPIENYIIGADLQLKVELSQQSQQILSNTYIKKSLDLQVSSSQQQFSSSCQFYSTDGSFSSLIFCPVVTTGSTIYTAYAAYPNSVGYLIGNTLTKQSEINFANLISVIDNQGSFTINQDAQLTTYDIYMPLIQDTVLRINKYEVQCQDRKLLFATDPAASVLFTICDNTLTQYILKQYHSNGIAQLISQKPLTYDGLNISTIQNMICIKGTLFIYNDSMIYAYDYINQGFIGQISVPAIGSGKTQQLTIYKESFLITVLDTPLTLIAQYSYNNFSTQDPIPMRNLQIDSSHPINTQGNIIAKRDYTETAFIESTTPGIYYMYRIESKQWSNQLYNSISILTSSQTIISSMFIYQFNPQVFTQILDQASFQYNLAVTQDQFNSNLQSKVQFTISEQTQTTPTPLQYTLVLNRDADTQEGVINQQAATLQQMKTQLQDTNFVSGQIFTFNDWEVFNACLFGWKGDVYTSIIQRLSTTTSIVTNPTFTILYDYTAVVTSTQIISFFQIDGDFTSCILLDDKGSLATKDNQNYSFTLYIICKKSINVYLINFETDQTTKKPNKWSLASAPLQYTYNENSDYPIGSFKTIISTTNKELLIYKINGMSAFSLTFDNDAVTATTTPLDDSFYVKQSTNVIIESNLQLTIYSTGIIKNCVRSAATENVVNLSDLLVPFNFIIDDNDYVKSVDQYSDTQFRIVYAQSYIYDITFSYSNQQLSISSVRQYYYQNAFANYISGFRGSKYTLLFGQNQLHASLIVTLYSNTIQLNNIYLIQSKQETTFLSPYLTPTCVEETSSNNVQLYLSNSQTYTIGILDNLGVKFNLNKSSLKQNTQVNITPLDQTNSTNVIQFMIQGSGGGGGGSGSTTFSSILPMTVFSLLGIIINIL